MKKFILKTRHGLLVVLGVVAFGFGVQQASAQQLLNPTGIFSDGGINWVSSNEAQAILNQEIAGLDQQLQSLPSTPLDLKRKFFHGITNGLDQGESVPEALDNSFVKFVAGYVDFPPEVPNSLPLSIWLTYYEEAAFMLQN